MAHWKETTLGSLDKGLAPGFILEQVWDLGKFCFLFCYMQIIMNFPHRVVVKR